MLWLLLTIGGSVAAGLANVFDKLLLRKKELSDPWTFTFWSGIFGLLALVLIPFGALSAPLSALLIAFTAGVLFLVGVFFFFQALERSQASVSLSIIGGLTPLATYGFSVLLLNSALGLGNLIGFMFIVGSAVLFFGIERSEIRVRSISPMLLSALLFGISNVLKKMAFNDTTFLPGLVGISVGSGALALASLMVPSVRNNIRSALHYSNVKNKVFYLNNRLLALLGTLGINGAIMFGHPALVEAGQSVKYIIIFLGGWLILREEFSGAVLRRKMIAIALMVFGFLWLGFVAYAESIPIDYNRSITWGVTFSSKFSRKLGIDPRENLNAIFNDLRPKTIRLIAYWDDIERTRGVFDFSDLDWQIQKASDAHIPIILAVGMKSPRWPECFIPSWASGLDAEQKEEALRLYIKEVILRYKHYGEITAWQIENEPNLAFGLCARRPQGFLEKEIMLVKSLDSRSVLVTDGGEFGDWYRAAISGDLFGTTMYRKIYPPSIGFLTGEIEYPISPSFFRFKEKLIRFLLHDYTKRFIVIELQAEPWGSVEIPLLSVQEQLSLFTPDYFKETIEYAKQAGFDTYYLWGAEWWFMMGKKYHNWTYWSEVKKVIQDK